MHLPPELEVWEGAADGPVPHPEPPLLGFLSSPLGPWWWLVGAGEVTSQAVFCRTGVCPHPVFDRTLGSTSALVIVVSGDAGWGILRRLPPLCWPLPSLSEPDRPPELSPLPSLPPERPQPPVTLPGPWFPPPPPPPPIPRASSSRLFQPLFGVLPLRSPWLLLGGSAPHSPLDILLLDEEQDEEDDEALLPQGRGIPAGLPIMLGFPFTGAWPAGPGT